MSEIHDDLPPRRQYTQGVWRGLIDDNITDMAQLVHFTIPAFPDPTLRFGPSRWQSRDATSHPSRGNNCLVVKDDQGEWWVIAWWPFA